MSGICYLRAKIQKRQKFGIKLNKVMNSKMDPMGRAILDYVKRQGRAADYWKTKKADRLHK